jgi:cytochrome c551/c552
MAQESQSFVHHLFTSNSSIVDMLEARYAFLNRPLASHYGIAVPDTLGDAFERVELPTGSPFRGLITQGALLVPTHKDGVPEIFRGKELNYLFACVELPVPASADIQAQISDQLNDTEATQAEKYAARNSQPACVGCHQRMDPLGKAFNAFDTAGRYSLTEASGAPIDTQASYDGVNLSGPADVAQLFKSKNFAQCVTSYVLGPMIHQALNIADAHGWCAVEKVLARAGTEQPGLRSIVTAALASDALRQRVIAAR